LRVDPLLLVIIAIIAATAVRVVYVLRIDPNWDLSLRMVSLVRMDAIAYGVVAMLLCQRSGLSPRAARVLAWCGVAGTALAVALYLSLPKDTDLFARTGLFSLISLSFAAFLPAASNWRRSGLPQPIENAVRAVARWSYALYLCQLAVMRAMNATFAGNAQTLGGCVLQALAFMTLSIACAALVYRYFEAPILRLRDRWTRGSPALAEDAESGAVSRSTTP
jgi:peptidoglycan/LPS O-acetylase OafA/YrhL